MTEEHANQISEAHARLVERWAEFLEALKTLHPDWYDREDVGMQQYAARVCRSIAGELRSGEWSK